MQSYIYLTIASLACTAAVQLNVGPQVFPDTQSSSTSSQKPGKRYATQEYTLFLTPDEIKALQGIKNSDNVEKPRLTNENQKQNDKEEIQLKWYNRQFLPEAPQLEIRGLAAHDNFFQKQNSDLDNHQGYYQYNNLYPDESLSDQLKDVQSYTEKENEFGNYYTWQKQQEENTRLESGSQNDNAKWKQYQTSSGNNQENVLNNEQLKQQWNRILEHNRAQLKSISPVSKESEALKQDQKSAEQIKKPAIETEIENLLRQHRNFVLAQQSGLGQEQDINQRPPVLIHKEVTLTKHLPVPFVKRVKVPVPTPVLVPVPEPYEVKIPHPYPVLYKF